MWGKLKSMFIPAKTRKTKGMSKPAEPKLTAADIVAQALATATVKGKLQAKSHPKADNPDYIQRSISSTWKSFKPAARILLKAIKNS